MKYCLGNFSLHGKPVICGRNIHNFDSCSQIRCFPIKPMTTYTTTCNITLAGPSVAVINIFLCGFWVWYHTSESLCIVPSV